MDDMGESMGPMVDPCHPGELLRADLEASDMRRGVLAAKLGMDRSNLYRLLDGRIALTARVALALEHMGWSTAEHWMRLQVQYDLAQARRAAA